MSDGKVREWISKDSYEMILNSVDSGIFEPDQIRSLAYGLSKKVGGAHDMRMPRKVEADPTKWSESSEAGTRREIYIR